MVGAMKQGGLRRGDVLVIVDVQNDFVSGSLAVPDGAEVVEPLNAWIEAFEHEGLVIVATRDWHPPNHCSFHEQGGRWPPHCIAGTAGAAFAPDLRLAEDTVVVSKAMRADRDSYSAFGDTDLESQLRAAGVTRIFVGGLATDYCVLETVLDARRLGFDVVVLTDAIAAADARAGDGARALARMQAAGAAMARSRDVDA
jgi:nicotinamidase/pyrazinamidase